MTHLETWRKLANDATAIRPDLAGTIAHLSVQVLRHRARGESWQSAVKGACVRLRCALTDIHVLCDHWIL